MFRNATANIFINTLAEMLESQRARQTVRMRQQHKAKAERFMQIYQTGPDGELQALNWTPESRQTEGGPQGQTRPDRPMRFYL